MKIVTAAAGKERLVVLVPRRGEEAVRDPRRAWMCWACLILAVTPSEDLSAQTGSPPAPASDEAAAQRLASLAGDGFRTYETEHFLIAYDTPFEALRPLVGRLEGNFDAIWQFCEVCALEPGPPANRFEVLLFDRHEDFARYAVGAGVSGAAAAGFYEQRTNLSAFCNTSNSPGVAPITKAIEDARRQLARKNSGGSKSASARARRRQLQSRISMLSTQRDGLAKWFNRVVFQHEAAHHMLFNLGVHVRGAANPQWLVEGLACQFEVPQVDSRGALRRVNHMRLDDFRTALGVPPSARKIDEHTYRAALDAGRVVPLRELIVDPAPFSDGKHIISRYGQVWALVYYLQRQHREALAGYLRGLTGRTPGVRVEAARELERFQAAFGNVDEAFERAWLSFVLKLRLDRKEAGR